MVVLRVFALVLHFLISHLGDIDTPQPGAVQPNVLMIAIDDQNDWIGCLGGHPLARTPHIDRLAARGTVFLNAHCQAPLCNPSRASLLTGRRPSSTGIYGLLPALRETAALRDAVTLPQYFRQHGYSTRMAGKIFHGGQARRSGDAEFEIVGPPSEIGPRPPRAIVKSPSGHPLVDWGTFLHDDTQKGDWKLADWTIEQLRQSHDKPFFICTGFFLPHVPCYVSPKWYEMFPESDLLLPSVNFEDRRDTPRFSWYLHWRLPEPRLRFLQEQDQWKSLVRSYLASTAFVDAQIGRILEVLDASPWADNTVVVLWSDHGWHLGEKLITGKNSLWERSTRVPLIFAGPGISGTARCVEPAELLDIYPTLAELCHLAPPNEQEGHSLVPQLRNSSAARTWPAITTHNQGNHSVRTRDWRYIHYADGSEELYDMQNDPREWTNLASDPAYGSTLRQHREQLPTSNCPAVEGSAQRILLFDPMTGAVNWEGMAVGAKDPIPELEDDTSSR